MSSNVLMQKLVFVAPVIARIILYLLMGLSVLSIGIIIERWWYFRKIRFNPRSFLELLSRIQSFVQQGRPEDAKRLFLEGADELSRVGDKELLPHLLAGVAEADLELGAVEEAETGIAIALEAAEVSKDPLARLEALRIAGRISHRRGQPALVRRTRHAGNPARPSLQAPLHRRLRGHRRIQGSE